MVFGSLLGLLGCLLGFHQRKNCRRSPGLQLGQTVGKPLNCPSLHEEDGGGRVACAWVWVASARVVEDFHIRQCEHRSRSVCLHRWNFVHYNASLEFVDSVREFHVYGAQPSDAWKLVFANNTCLQFGRVRPPIVAQTRLCEGNSLLSQCGQRFETYNIRCPGLH